MSNIEIQELLAKLRDAIRKAELDAETRSVIRDLDADIHDLLESNEPETASVLKRARAAEAEFAVKHPTTAGILSQIIEALARMGV